MSIFCDIVNLIECVAMFDFIAGSILIEKTLLMMKNC